MELEAEGDGSLHASLAGQCCMQASLGSVTVDLQRLATTLPGSLVYLDAHHFVSINWC